MRPKIKQLIDQIERDGWRYDPASKLTVDAHVGLTCWVSPTDWPRISCYGVGIDGTSYISFAPDEAALVQATFKRREDRVNAEEADRAATKLDAYLAKHP